MVKTLSLPTLFCGKTKTSSPKDPETKIIIFGQQINLFSPA